MANNFTKTLHEYAKDFNKPFVDGIRESINKIKERYCMSNGDLADLLDMDEAYINTLTDKEDNDVDCNIDLRTISILTLLWGNLHVLTDTPSGKMYNNVNTLVKNYMDDKYPQPKEDKWNDKVKQILNLFGVTDEDDLDHLLNAVAQVRGAINEYDKSCKENCTCEKEKDPVYVDEKGNFHSQKPYKACDCKKEDCKYNEKVKGVIYDSENMEKPETFEFTGSLDKLIPNVVDFLSKILK